MRCLGFLPFALLLVSSPALAQSAPPQPLEWHPGAPPPPGYHVEEKPRRGLVIAGAIVGGIPYFFSVVAAASANSQNATGYLYLPVAGPWITLGRRSSGCDLGAQNMTTDQSLQCTADIFAVMGLIADGILQGTGAALLLSGELATKEALVRDVRDDEAVRVAPMHVGSGFGAGVYGRF